MAHDTPSDKPTRKPSSVRHTRAIQRDRSKRPVAAPPDPEVVARLTDLIHPATLAQLDHFRQLGLRERLLTLPVMVALVLTMIWRQIGSVCELVRLLNTEGFLWCSPVPASQQALSQRLLTFPATLFQRVLEAVLPTMHARFQERQRPLPRALAWAQERYTHLLAVDGSTLDALLRKAGLLRDLPTQPLAGRMFALLDLRSRLPTKLWYDADPKAHDQRHWETILAALTAGMLLVLDAGYTNFGRFLQLTQAKVTWITRAKSNLAYEVERCLGKTDRVQDAVVVIGQGAQRQRVRLVQVLVRGQWYRYLTNELDAERLPALYVAALYAHRWGIEEAYATVKRLLGLAYFWVGSQNGVELQVWATWLLYAVLVDLTEGVAERLRQPFGAVSLEMVYRSLYYFTQAYHRGETTDPIDYLASHAKLLGIVKRKRKPPSDPLPWSDLTEAVRA
jgi:Transposase DDE domain